MGSSFLVRDSFLSGEGTPLGLHLLLWEDEGRGEGGGRKNHEVGGTPIMPLPTSANPGLCCNRVKKMQELQYTMENLQEKDLENLQEKDLNFTRKGTFSQINF